MNTPATPSMEGTPQVPALSEGARIINTFIAPSKTFADLRRNARWFVPYLLMAIVGVAFSFTVQKKIGWEAVQETQIRIGPAGQRDALEKMPPDQKQQQLNMGLKITKFFGYAFPTIFLLLFLMVVALILWLTFKFGAGTSLRFGQSLAIVMYASLPSIVKSVIGIIVVFAGVDPDNFMIQNPVGTNLGYFMNIAESNRFLYSLATSFDAITLWMLWLTALGFTIVGNVKKGTAIAIVFGWWLVVVLAGGALGAAFS